MEDLFKRIEALQKELREVLIRNQECYKLVLCDSTGRHNILSIPE